MEPRARNLAEELRLLIREQDELSLRAAALAAELHEMGYGEYTGSVSTADWMRHEFQISYGRAADLVRVGMAMDALLEGVEAVQEHEIGFQHLVCLARAKAAVRERPLDTEHLLAEAKEVSVGRFWHICLEARHAADPQGLAREQAGDVGLRELTINQHQDGRVAIGGIFDSTGGAAIQAALEPLARRAGQADTRYKPQRLADALVELASHALDQSTPRQRPHLNVTATLGTVYEIPGSGAAQLDYGLPVAGQTVRRISCDCSLTRYVFDGQSVLIDLGREKRVVSTKLRQALGKRDRHCRWPGCTRPASWCDAHHLIPWQNGGPTNLANTLLLCGRHHWMVHEGRWQLFVYPDGRIRVIRPPIEFLAPPRAPDSTAAA